MSTNLVPANLSIPAHALARMQAPIASGLSSAIAGGISGGSAFPRLSIKGSRFRVVFEGTETVLPQIELDVVIVGANPGISKAWYEGAWSADAPTTAPDCYSLDGKVPSPSAAKPQSEACASCQWNSWGSKQNLDGKDIKACPDQKRLAVIAADDPEGDIYLLQVTPAALKGLNAYHKELTMRGIPAEIVKTRISFDTDASFPKLEFRLAGFLTADEQEIVDTLFDSPLVAEITGVDELQATAVAIAAPAPVAAKPRLVALKPAPVVHTAEEVAAEEEEEETAPVPAPARGFGKAAAPAAAPAPAPAARGFGKAAAPAAAAAPATRKAKPQAEEPTGKLAPSALADQIAALMMDDDDDDA